MEKKKIIQLILKVLVSTTLFYILALNVDFGEVLIKIRMMDAKYIVPVVIAIIFNYVVSTIRWKRLLIFPNSNNASTGYLTILYFTGSFFNNFMPTSIGGDVYKILKLGKLINSKSGAFAATFMERLLGVVALLIISAFSFINSFGYLWVIGGALSVIAGGLLVFKIAMLISLRISPVKKLMDAINTYKNNPDAVWYAFALSFVVQLLAIVSQLLIFYSLGSYPPLLYAFSVLPVITLAGFFIPSLNGIGVQDALYVSMFSLVGVSADLALSASVIYHFSRLAVSLVGGVMYASGMDK